MKCDYQIKFKANKSILNLFNIRKTYIVHVDIEELDSSDTIDNSSELDDINYVIKEYGKLKSLSDVQLLCYTRYVGQP